MAHQEPGSKSEAASAMRDSAVAMSEKAMAAMANAKDSFVKHAALGDMYELEAARIALKRTRREDIRQFARQMIEDHTRTSAALKAAVTGDGAVPVPDSLDRAHQTLVDDLDGASDESFDRRYLAQQKSAHSGALTLFRTYRDSGDDVRLGQLARETVPILERHMAMIERM